MSYYNGKEPCPGCGMPGDQRGRDTKASLCEDCKRLLELGRVADRNHTDKYVSVELMKSFFKGCQLTMYGKQENKHQYILSGPYLSDAFNDKIFGDGSMTKAFMKLIKQLDVGKCTSVGFVHFPDGWAEFSYLNLKTAQALVQLIETTLGWGRELYNDGFQKGKNLLIGLTAGTHTLAEFDEAINQELENQQRNSKRKK